MMFVTTGGPIDFVIERRRDTDSGDKDLRDCAPCIPVAISAHRQTEPPATGSPVRWETRKVAWTLP